MKARENPFRSECIEALPYRSEGFSWAALEARLEELRGRGAIVGPEGHGKTTLLLEWAGRTADAIVLRLGERQRWLDAGQRIALKNCMGRRIFIDSVEQLCLAGWLELRWRTRGARSMVVTAHRRGRLPVLFECESSPALLGELIRELDGGPVDHGALWARHGGNVRAAFAELYGQRSRVTAPAARVPSDTARTSKAGPLPVGG